MKFTQRYITATAFVIIASQSVFAQTPATDTPATPSAPVMLLPDDELVGEDATTLENAPEAQPIETIMIETSNGGISVESLQQIDPEILGTLTDATGDLGFGIWDGTARPDVHNLIANLPTQIDSTALRDLKRRLLLTTADLKTTPTTKVDGLSLTQLRVKQLMNMGLLDDAVDMIGLANQTGVGSSLRTDLIEAHLFLNNFSAVCSEVAQVNEQLGEAYWQKLLVFCQALAGDIPGAEFGTTLLADMGEDDPTFFTLIEKLTQTTDAKLKTMPNPTALHMAMAQLTETALPEDVLASKNPSVLRAITANSATSITIRLKAAEQAALVDAIPRATLAEIYQSVEFSSNELANPISTATADNTPRNRALLYQAAVNEPVPEGRALIIQKAIELAKQAEVYPLAIKVHLENIMQIQASIDVWWFAGDAARALYVASRPLPAQAWLGHLRTQALREVEAQTQLVDFWPLAGISAKGLLPSIDDGARRAWVDSQLANSPEEREAIARITRGYILLDALDQKIPPSAWADLATMADTSYARLPNPAINHMMLDAAMGGRKGEAIAWAIILLGELGTSYATAETTADAVVALRALGLQKEARAIALEAAIKNGL